MSEFKNLHEVSAALERLIPTGRIVYNQDNMRTLLNSLDNPQNNLKIIHVAGTSGKTSTSYYVAAGLLAAGHKVGLTVSPHIDSVLERVQLNMRPLDETKFAAYFSEFLPLVDSSGVRPSYFECLIAFAYWVFDREKVDYAVIEVGLGGRKDATNMVTRADKVCVITDIGFDHTEILGDTLAQIAYEKAGIIGSTNRVFMYEQEAEVMAVIDDIVAEKQADLKLIQEILSASIPRHLPLFQRRNWFLAMNVVDAVLAKPLTKLQREKASHTRIPARMEIIDKPPHTIILDGSHNGQKMQILVVSLASRFPDQKFAVLAGFVEVSNPRAFEALDALMPLIGSIIFTEFSGKQDGYKKGINADILSDYIKTRNPAIVPIVIKDPSQAYQALLKIPDKLLLVTGSFYLLNHIRPLVFKDRL